MGLFCKGELLVLNSEGDEEKGEKGRGEKRDKVGLTFPQDFRNRTLQ